MIFLPGRSVSRTIMEGDSMYSGNIPHYFGVGESAARCIQASLLLADRSDPKTILDFASGAGRVLRWIRALYPDARIVASDIDKRGLDFCAKEFNSEPWASNPDFLSLRPPCRFDLIWCGSLLTHINERSGRDLISSFCDWLSPGGIALVTSLGRKAIFNKKRGSNKYLSSDLFENIAKDYKGGRYGFAEYPGQNGYGISVVSLHWALEQIYNRPDISVLAVSEHVWDNHHDTIGFQKLEYDLE